MFAERNVLRVAGPACPYVETLHRTFKDDDYLYFLLECAGGGDLTTHIR